MIHLRGLVTPCRFPIIFHNGDNLCDFTNSEKDFFFLKRELLPQEQTSFQGLKTILTELPPLKMYLCILKERLNEQIEITSFVTNQNMLDNISSIQKGFLTARISRSWPGNIILLGLCALDKLPPFL